MNKIEESKVVEILKQCYDPELPVDLWNLGLIYDIQIQKAYDENKSCLLYTSPSPRDAHESRMPSSA